MNGDTPKTIIAIYCIRNKVNGFVYIGATKKGIEHRFKKHISKSKYKSRYKKENLFTKDIKKYGSENFTIELVENVYDLDLVSEIEDYWIGKFDKSKLYNSVRSSYPKSFVYDEF